MITVPAAGWTRPEPLWPGEGFGRRPGEPVERFHAGNLVPLPLSPRAHGMVRSVIEGLFPTLRNVGYQIVLPRTDQFNCFAYAAGYVDRWLCPPSLEAVGRSDTEGKADLWWPAGLPDDNSLDTWIRLYQGVGYRVCDDDPARDDPATVEKIVLWAQPGASNPCHAARQSPNGRWVDKLGRLWGIAYRSPHDIPGNDQLGEVALYMYRPRADRPTLA